MDIVGSIRIGLKTAKKKKKSNFSNLSVSVNLKLQIAKRIMS